MTVERKEAILNIEGLTPLEIERYSRQLILPGWSAERQTSLGDLHVLVSNALPSAALYLAAAGVGRISLYGEKTPAGTESGPPHGALSLCNQLAGLNTQVTAGEWAGDSDCKSPQCVICVAPTGDSSLNPAGLAREPWARITVNLGAEEVRICLQKTRSEQGESAVLPRDLNELLPVGLPAGALAAAMILEWWPTRVDSA